MELSLGNALHLAPLLWGFICLPHAMHRADPFPGCCFGAWPAARPTALVNQGNQAEAQPSQTNSAQPFWGAPVRLWAEGGGARGKRPAPAVHFPAPAVLEVGPCRRPRPPGLLWPPVGGSPRLFIGGSLFSPFAVFQRSLAARRRAGRPTGPVRAEGGKKIANRPPLARSVPGGPRGAPALFSAPGGRCTPNAPRRGPEVGGFAPGAG